MFQLPVASRHVTTLNGDSGSGGGGGFLVRMCGPTFQNQPHPWALKIGTHSYTYRSKNTGMVHRIASRKE